MISCCAEQIYKETQNHHRKPSKSNVLLSGLLLLDVITDDLPRLPLMQLRRLRYEGHAIDY